MVKAGETYRTDVEKLIDNVLKDEPSRPRAICDPSWQGCGWATYYQATIIFPWLKKAVPGFIHGKSCHDLQDHFKEYWKPFSTALQMWAISWDGAAFDSNQHVELQNIVDKEFWHVVKLLLGNLRQTFLLALEKFWTKMEADWFVIVEGFEDFWQVSQAVKSKYMRCWTDGRWASAFHMILVGSTFSGHPTLTTLGNTLRSLLYIWWTLERIGFRDCWILEEGKPQAAASGDDSICVGVGEDIKKKFVEELKATTAKDKKTPNIGLGQCIDGHTIFVRDWWDFDFCSKWCFYEDGEWAVTRDYEKTVLQKQAYVGDNVIIQSSPYLHAAAISEGLKSEGVENTWLYTLTVNRAVAHGYKKETEQEVAKSAWRVENP